MGQGGITCWMSGGALPSPPAVLAQVSPSFDPKPKCASPFHLPVESILRAGRWIELLWPLPFLQPEQNRHFPLHHSSTGDRVLLLPSGHLGGCKRSRT